MPDSTSDNKLTLDDIADLRAYERERGEFHARMIELKKRRRVHVGPFVTILFENRDTVRFQIQEMARAEKLMSDEQIQTELDIYNVLIPADGRIAATMFIELTTEAELREWLPKLVGIERAVELRIGGDVVVKAVPEAGHAEQLTREEMTSAVHYIEFGFDESEIKALEDASQDLPVRLAVAHSDYDHETPLESPTVAEILSDLKS